jgi:hypothetical protein
MAKKATPPNLFTGLWHIDNLHGMIVIHLGDESDFVAKRAKAPKRPKKRK